MDWKDKKRMDFGTYKELFDRFDKKNTGLLDAKGMVEAMMELGKKLTLKDIQKLNSEAHTQLKEKGIGFAKFLSVAGANRFPVTKESDIRTVFEGFDYDGDGFISLEDMQKANKYLGEEMTDEQIIDLIAVADTDGDEKVSYDEFFALLRIKKPSSDFDSRQDGRRIRFS